MAIAFAKAGADVAISWRSGEAAAMGVAREIESLGVRAISLQCDVSDMTSVEKTCDQIEQAFGGVDILVNNAGVVRDNLFMMLEDKDWQDVFSTNVMGAVHCSRSVVRGMMMRRWGRIINMSSIAASRGGRGQGNYAASKGALESLTQSLAAELASRNILVNCIAPGVIETDMTREVISLAKQMILDHQLIKRHGKPEDIAAWAVMLASEHAGFMTGQVITVDGGFLLG
jgi:3-oxoacyl-[acyl-carrier protein] reductase